ncbi:hypothetical protein GCM10010990_36540 [Croceicoccus mobilis]|uniref:Uncharacterized protein n=1 Tax=Croceicoccus mobilis TaxID=1703339 RepID=A0A916Z9K1_9SPHN|nr:hypothetical protein GCM10010990_36540 [Croceicoccus mobilis]
MFENRGIRDLFNQSHHGDSGSQPRALTGAILAYATPAAFAAKLDKQWPASLRSPLLQPRSCAKQPPGSNPSWGKAGGHVSFAGLRVNEMRC